MRISDCSSYVCSSYLTAAAELSENIAKPIAQTVEHAPQILVTRPATQKTPVSETSPTSGLRHRQSVVKGKKLSVSVELSGRRIIRNKKTREQNELVVVIVSMKNNSHKINYINT